MVGLKGGSPGATRWLAALAVIALAFAVGPAVTAASEHAPADEMCVVQPDGSCSPVEMVPDDGGTEGEGFEFDPEMARRHRESMPTNVSGTPEHPVVAVDITQVAFPDAKPWLNPATNRTMVPIRFVSEAMAATVAWEEATQTVTIVREGLQIALTVGDHTAIINGTPMTFDAPPILVPPGRVLVPLRFISEGFGATVDWVGSDPPPQRPEWSGRYQVWIFVPWGYFGSAGLEQRLNSFWLRRD